MNSTLRTLLMTTAMAWQVAPASAGVTADAHEAQVPARIGVAVEPSHRAQVIAPGLKLSTPVTADVTWVVTEPARRRVLLPGEERMLLSALALEHAVQDEIAAGAAQPGRRGSAVGSATTPLATVYFPFASARPLAVGAIADLAMDLPRTQGLRVVGHTDSAGSDGYNLSLSLRRANSVATILSRHGVAKDRLDVSGKGEADPVSSDDAKNRRVEIRLGGEGGK